MPRNKKESINKEEAMSLLDSGQSRRDVAEKYGVSLSTLVKHLGLAKARNKNGNGPSTTAVCPSEKSNNGVVFNARSFTQDSARNILSELENQRNSIEGTLEEVKKQISRVGELVA